MYACNDWQCWVINSDLSFYMTKISVTFSQVTASVFKNHLRITCGTSWHAAGLVTVLKNSSTETKIVQHAVNIFPGLEQETDMSTGEGDVVVFPYYIAHCIFKKKKILNG